MIRVYMKGDDVPDYIAEVIGSLTPCVKFNGFGIIYKFKGNLILKPIFGESVMKISDGVNCQVIFKTVVMKQKSSPLNIIRRLIRAFNK